MSYDFQDKLLGIVFDDNEVNNAKIFVGYYFKTLKTKNEDKIVCSLDKNEKLKKNWHVDYIYKNKEKYDLEIFEPEFTMLYEEKKYNELKELCKYFRNKKFPDIPFSRFFAGENILQKLQEGDKKSLREKHKEDRKRSIVSIFSFIFPDIYNYIIYKKESEELEKVIEPLAHKVLMDEIFKKESNKDDYEKLENLKKRKNELIKAKSSSSAGVITFILSVFTVLIYTQQCQISKRQVSLQEKQIEMENRKNLPSFYIYVKWNQEMTNEDICIEKTNNEDISDFIFESSVICQIKTKDGIIRKRITNYFDNVSMSLVDRNKNYILIGTDNYRKLTELKRIYNTDEEFLDIQRFVKLSYKDYLSNIHEEYYFVIPFVGSSHWDRKLASVFFDTSIEEITMEELSTFIYKLNEIKNGPVIKSANESSE